jgi:hypothetical protein
MAPYLLTLATLLFFVTFAIGLVLCLVGISLSLRRGPEAGRAHQMSQRAGWAFIVFFATSCLGVILPGVLRALVAE